MSFIIYHLCKCCWSSGRSLISTRVYSEWGTSQGANIGYYIQREVCAHVGASGSVDADTCLQVRGDTVVLRQGRETACQAAGSRTRSEFKTDQSLVALAQD